jgi:signal transduction histidine kinase
MKTKSTIVCILLSAAFALQVAAQNKVSSADRIRQSLTNLKGEEKLKALMNLYELTYENDNEQEQMNCLTALIDEAQKQGDIEKESYGRISRLCTYYNYDRNDKLNQSMPNEMAFFANNKQRKDYYHAWSLKANNYFFSGEYYTALREAEKIFTDAKKRDNSEGISLALTMMGQVHFVMKDNRQACKNFQAAANRLIESDSKNYRAFCNLYYSYCFALTALNNHQEVDRITKDWLYRIDLWKKEKEEKGLETGALASRYLYCYLAMAQNEITKNNLDKAEAYLKEAEAMGRGQENIIRGNILSVRETYYRERKEFAKAIQMNDESHALAKQFGDSLGIVNIQMSRATTLMEMGKKDEAAVIYAHLIDLKDSINSAENRRLLNEMNALFHADYMINEARNEMGQRKISIMAVIIVFAIIIIAVLVYLIRARYRMIRQLRSNTQQLVIAKERTMESAKMKESFIHSMSHEIRTPLNIINGFTQAITLPGITLSDEERQDVVKRIADATHNITVILDNLLELSKQESLGEIKKKQILYCNDLCQQAIAMSGIQSTEAVKFEFVSTLDAMQTIKTDRDCFIKIVVELLHNAQKFTQEGTIRLSLNRNMQPAILYLTVENTGPIIPANEKDHIFETFVKLDAFKEGVGAGLSMCRLLAKRIGGSIRLDPTYKDGNRFMLTLPM